MRYTRLALIGTATAILMPTVPAPAATVTPVGKPVVVISSEGGFVAPGYIKSSLPSLVAYSNGAVLTRFDSMKRPDLREMRLRIVDPKLLQQLTAAIAKAAVKPAGGWGFPGVADVPNTRIQLAYPGMRKDISVYALSFTNGGDVTPAQAKARRSLQAAIDRLDKAAKARPAKAWMPKQYEAWAMQPLTSSGGVGIANPASVFCTSMGGTLKIVDTASGQVGNCQLPDGTTVEEWAYFRSVSPTLAQWPAQAAVPKSECTLVASTTFKSTWSGTNETGRWLLPSGQAPMFVFRPVLLGETPCRRT